MPSINVVHVVLDLEQNQTNACDQAQGASLTIAEAHCSQTGSTKASTWLYYQKNHVSMCLSQLAFYKISNLIQKPKLIQNRPPWHFNYLTGGTRSSLQPGATVWSMEHAGQLLACLPDRKRSDWALKVVLVCCLLGRGCTYCLLATGKAVVRTATATVALAPSFVMHLGGYSVLAIATAD